MKKIRKRYPRAICRRSRKGWAVYSRPWGLKIAEAGKRTDAIAAAVEHVGRGR